MAANEALPTDAYENGNLLQLSPKALSDKVLFILDSTNHYSLHPQCQDNFDDIIQKTNVSSLKMLQSIDKISQILQAELETQHSAKVEELKPDPIAKYFLLLSIGLMAVFFLLLIIDSY